MDPELIAFLKAEFGSIDARFDKMQNQMNRRFDEAQEQNRHTQVLIEDLHSDVKLLAEGHEAQDERSIAGLTRPRPGATRTGSISRR